jgi:hypothetical protein
MNTIYPFRPKNSSGKLKWWQNVQLSYSSTLDNQVNTKDSALFTKHFTDNLENGFRHSIPLSTNIKLGTMFNITPSVTYNGVMTTKYIDYEYLDSDRVNHTIITKIHETRKIQYAQAVVPGISFTLNPRFYGMYNFKGKKLKAIRHVMTPTVSYSLIPDLSREHAPPLPYYKNVFDSINNQSTNIKYSVFDRSLVGSPPRPNGISEVVNYGVTNRLEMKVLTKNDTSEQVKKIPLLENFDFNGNYNCIADSMRLSNITFNVGTRLFDNKYEIRLNGIIDPYYYQPTYENGALVGYRRTKYLAVDNNNNFNNFSLGKITSYSITISTRFQSPQKKKTDNTKSTDNQNYNKGYVDFDIPWTLNVNYSYGYTNYNQPVANFNNVVTNQPTVVQTLSLNGDVSFTKKWKVGFMSGYDFTNKKFSSTSLNFYRDLHCWEMRLMIIPYGPMQSYTFTINVKSALLHDIKYEKKKSPWDAVQ